MAAGTLEAGFDGALGADGGALPKVGDDLPLDRLPPRGIITVSYTHLTLPTKLEV